ncbi:hypothetical protein ACHQM5_030682 [Ranunculus cassubicifolius]
MGKKNNPASYCSSLVFTVLACLHVVIDAQKIDVGVILDKSTLVGKITQSCIIMGLTDYYSAHNTSTRLVLHIRDSNEDVVDAASSAVDLMKNVQVQAILGPQSSSEAKFVVEIGNKAQVPIISFTATSPSLSFGKTPYFIRATLNDFTQVKAIAALVQAFGWREIVPIYEDTDYGEDMIPYLTDAIQNISACAPYRSVLSLTFTDDQIRVKLLELMTMQTRVFVVHMRPSLASRLFSIAEQVGMMNKGYAWIITDGLTDILDSMDVSLVSVMQGVLGLKPHVPNSEKLDTFKRRWKRRFLTDNPNADKAEMSAVGLWAYDSVWALATAAEKAITASPEFERANNGKKSTDLKALGTSQNGPKLLRSLLQTNFTGLSGKFWLKDGQLQPPPFKIVNVKGKGGTEIGFWSPTFGISRKLPLTGSKSTYTVTKDNLGPIIWPGESVVVPKGWELPTSGKKLKIGVPVKDGFKEFVEVKKNNRGNAPEVTGFCIDVFKAVIGLMPYSVPYEFVPFENNDGQRGGSYNDLIDQVVLQVSQSTRFSNFYFHHFIYHLNCLKQKVDGVVGDITILANRSLYVDFALPFTESGVSMVVPLKDDGRKNTWIFLEPLTMGLWVTSGAFFIFTGFVVWVLEHRINKDFRGRPAQQVGMIFWFSFSTLVFAHKEKVVSNLARFVLIIWIFVVLILTSSYTASLTSMLTVQKLQPTITDIHELIKSGEFVGYQTGSFITNLLKDLGVDPSKTRDYGSPDEYYDALSRGSQNGGVSAIIDEIPYIKLFIAKHCKKFTMVGPTYRTAGFGFAFPKGSPLVPDISRAILQVIEKNKFESQDLCPEKDGNIISSSSLTVDSFKGLFLIAGISSGVAFIIYLFMFVYEHKSILASEGSVSQKVYAMATQFDKEKDTSSCGSKKILSSKEMTVLGSATNYDTSAPQSPASTFSPDHERMVFSNQESFSYSEPSTPIRGPPVVIDISSSN